MKRSREELTRIHKEKCKELKQIRAKMAEDLGVELHQTECTYEGYCSGTCPKCMQEELKLNAAIMKKQLEESDIKRRVAAAGLTTAAALCLSGCNTAPLGQLEGDVQYVPSSEEIAGGMSYLPPEDELTGAIAVPEESAEEVVPETTEEAVPEEKVMELEGDVAYVPEATEEVFYEGELEIPESAAEICDTNN